MQGWVKLHRSILDWEWYSDTNTFKVFMHLLLTVNHEEKKWRGIVINAGQIVTSRANLAEQLNLGVQAVRTSLDKLKSTGELTIATTNKYTIITVTNWIKYQDTNQQVNQQLTNKQPTTNQQLTTTKECKNERRKEKKENIYPPEFEIFWEKFPRQRRGGRDDSLSAWMKAIKRSTPEEILNGLETYLGSSDVATGYAAGAARWLNADGWANTYKQLAGPKTLPKGEYLKGGMVTV